MNRELSISYINLAVPGDKPGEGNRNRVAFLINGQMPGLPPYGGSSILDKGMLKKIRMPCG